MFIHSVSVEISRFCAISTGEWAVLPPLDLSVYCRIQWRRSSRKLLGFPVLFMVEFCLTLFLSFPGCSHPGLVGAPSPGCGFTGLVAWSLLAPGSWKPPCQSTSFARSVVLWRWCGADDSLPLVSSLIAAPFGLSPYGLAIAALPLVSRPWTGLCWSHLLSLSSGGSVRGYTAPVGWLRGAFPCFAYCPTSSVLKWSSFGFSASSFAPSLRDGVTLPGRVCLSPRSERSLFLHLPCVWLESSR